MDDSFGPRLFGHFDFTLLFEHTIFHIVPSSILLFTLPYYIHKIIKCRPVVRPSWLLWAKLAVAFALAGLQLATVVFWYRSPLNSKVAQAASILSFLSFMGVIVMTYVSHIHFRQPDLFLASYINITLLFDLVTIYSYFHRTSLGSIARLSCALPALKFALVVLEEISKRKFIIAKNRHQLGSELTAGFWSRSTFLWINPLLLFGFRNLIDNKHLPDIGHQFSSKDLYGNLEECWGKQNQKSRFALLGALVFSMPWPFLYVILPRLFLVGFTFSQPFLLQDIVNAASGEHTQPEYISKEEETTALILATALVFCGKALSRNWFSHIRNQIMVCIRAILTSAIYQKSLLLSTSESDESAAITLISTDVPGTEELISLLYDSLAMILEVGFGVAVLSIFVGVASVFTIVTAIIVAVLSKRMAKQMGITRKLWNEHIEERVAATSNILAQIKDIKMTGLAPSMETYLNDLRVKEVEVSLRTRRIICITFGISAFADTVTPAIVVAAALFWTRAAQTMSSARFYTILAVVTMIAQPLASFFASLPEWSAGFACLSRIQAYLTQDELKDPRRIGRASSTSSSIATDALGSGATSVALPVQYAIELSGVNVSMDLTGSILRDASIVIKSGEITMIHGSVGCGKSTLLKVMLGEMELRNGLALLRSPSIAFAGQRPWLLNTTIRLNIIGHKAYNHALYQKTIFICALGVDFESLPDGDQTIVGSGGCILSGGQMQRISIARAIYVEADVTILDDPFSSLDRETSALVRIRLISDGNATPNGRTLVMTTSMKQHLVDADTVFRVTDEGHVVALTKHQVNEELEDLARNHRSQKVSPTEYDATAEKPSEPPIVQPTSSDDADDIYNAQRDTVNTYSSLSLYAYFFRPAGVLFVTLWVVAVTLAAVSERLPNIFVRIWLDTDAGNNLYFIGYALLCVAHPLLNCLSAMFFYYYVNAKTANKLHKNLVKATFRSTFEFITTEDAGSILNRFSSDTSMATQRVPALIMPTVFRAVSVIIDIGIIGSGAAYAAPAIPFFLGLIGSIQQYYLRTSRQLRVLELDTSKRLIRHFTETAAGIDHIRAFRWQEEVTKEFFSILDLTQKPFYFLYCIQQWLECALDFSSAAAAILVVSLALKFSNTASANSMGLALLSLIGFSSTISEWVQASVAMETAFGAVTRIRSYCDRTPSEKYKDGKTPVTSQWPSRGQLELNCVSAFYRDDTMPQFNNATAIIRPGETLGIVGRTGSGKTTVLLSILNLVQYKGTISIDDREIRTVPPDLLRARITTITQGGIHLRGSVKFNLDPFDPAQRPPTCIVTNEMYQRALDRVGLWDIISRRGDLSSRMKDVSLSHGQRQLFQLARAILHHEITGSKIILMDEVTSSLDEDTEARMAAVIARAFGGCAKVIVSHRYATLDKSDAIMVMDQGRARVIRHTPGQTDWR